MMTTTRASHAQHTTTNTGFYATSLFRSDIRPKRAPLERTISKDKIRNGKRKPSVKLNPVSALAIKEVLGLSHTQSESTSEAMSFLQLPQEILSQILGYLRPVDVVHVGQTCRAAQAFVVPENKLLWQTVFQHIFDDPRLAWSQIPESIRSKRITKLEEPRSWYDQLKRRCLAWKTIDPAITGSSEQNQITADEVVETLLEIIDTAKTRPTDTEIARGAVPQIDDRSSLNLSLLTSASEPWSRLENLIHDTHTPATEEEIDVSAYLTGRPVTRSITLQKRRASRSDAQSRLHVLYGTTVRDELEHGSKGHARRIVYDWSTPTEENEFGPFKVDGSGEINWKVLEAIMTTIMRSFNICTNKCFTVPRGFCYSIPSRSLQDPTVPEDWAGVTGKWLGTYSFLDYADLFHFNTWNDVATIPTLEEVPEAHGDLMTLTLKLNPKLERDPRLQSKLPICDSYPPLYFSGDSATFDPFGHPQMIVGIRGRISLCPGGREVKWKYIISYRGMDQWQLEGVQPGGIRSGAVYGTWTQWGHEEHAPVGAFMYIRQDLTKGQEVVLSRRRRDSR